MARRSGTWRGARKRSPLSIHSLECQGLLPPTFLVCAAGMTCLASRSLAYAPSAGVKWASHLPVWRRSTRSDFAACGGWPRDTSSVFLAGIAVIALVYAWFISTFRLWGPPAPKWYHWVNAALPLVLIVGPTLVASAIRQLSGEIRACGLIEPQSTSSLVMWARQLIGIVWAIFVYLAVESLFSDLLGWPSFEWPRELVGVVMCAWAARNLAFARLMRQVFRRHYLRTASRTAWCAGAATYPAFLSGLAIIFISPLKNEEFRAYASMGVFVLAVVVNSAMMYLFWRAVCRARRHSVKRFGPLVGAAGEHDATASST